MGRRSEATRALLAREVLVRIRALRRARSKVDGARRVWAETTRVEHAVLVGRKVGWQPGAFGGALAEANGKYDAALPVSCACLALGQQATLDPGYEGQKHVVTRVVLQRAVACAV